MPTAGYESENPHRSGTVFVVIPVFDRWHHTKACIDLLRRQTYRDLVIVVSDGGSTDGTRERLRTEWPDIILLFDDRVRWWTGSTELGIDYALEHGEGTDFVLMLNNDTVFPDDYVEILVHASQVHDAAVGAKVVDSDAPGRILDAGEFINWPRYDFPVKSEIGKDEHFFDKVEVLPGRGTLVPLHMIHSVGNVDAKRFPHYMADIEFTYRLKRAGFRLGVCYDTAIQCHTKETGIVPEARRTTVGRAIQELFSRRSMTNVIDHFRFISLHAPADRRYGLMYRLMRRSLRRIAYGTWLFYPLWPLFLIRKIVLILVFQPRRAATFFYFHARRAVRFTCRCICGQNASVRKRNRLGGEP